MGNIIEIEHLYKSFGEVRAVNDLSFRVKEEELFAFLGLNGAGKSTTISVICGQLKKDSGSVRVGGVKVEEGMDRIRREVGVVFQNCCLDKVLTVEENLSCRAALYGITGDAYKKRLEELREMFELSGLLDRTLGKLSGGERRRVDIARAIIHRPRLLILDEPTTGLDPQTRRLVWDRIESLRKNEGLTVFLTTHYMEEAADADYVVILDSGSIAAEGTPLELKNTYAGDYLMLYGVSKEEAEGLGYKCEQVRQGYRIYLPDTACATELIRSKPEIFRDYEVIKGKMDDVFLAATGKQLTGGEVK